jgi:hypothetical protein
MKFLLFTLYYLHFSTFLEFLVKSSYHKILFNADGTGDLGFSGRHYLDYNYFKATIKNFRGQAHASLTNLNTNVYTLLNAD